MFDTLTDEQRVAATYDGGHLLVVAGAGTGKTTALAARLAHLVASGVDPGRILLLTFSRRAAAELLRRAEQTAAARDVAGGRGAAPSTPSPTGSCGSTARALGLDPSFTVLDQADAADLLALCRAEVGRWRRAGSARAAGPARTPWPRSCRACVNTRTPLSAVLGPALPVVPRGARRAAAPPSPPTPPASGRTRCSTTTTCSCAGPRCSRVPEVAGGDRRPLRPRARRRVPGHQRAPGRHPRAAWPAPAPRITAVGDDAQAIYGFRAATVAQHPRLPGALRRRRGAARATTTARPADPRHRQRRARASRASATRRSCGRPGPPAPGPRWSPAPTRATSPPRCAPASSNATKRGVALRDQAVLFRTGHHSDLLELELSAPPHPVREVRRPEVPRGRPRQGPRVAAAGSSRTRATSWPGSACCSCSTASARPPRAESSTRSGSHRRRAAAPVAALDGAARPAGRRRRSRRRARRRRRPSCPGGRSAGRARARLARPARRAPLRRRRGPPRRPRRPRQAAAAAPSLERFLVELTLDPPASTGDLAGPPAPRRRLPHASPPSTRPRAASGTVVHLLHVADGNLPSDLATGDADERRGGAPAALRRRHPGPGRAALPRAAALPPPPPAAATTPTATPSRADSSPSRCWRRSIACSMVARSPRPTNPRFRVFPHAPAWPQSISR